MKKRGQFYLIAAIIIITILFSLYSIKNYAKRDAPETIVYDLKDEFNIESGEVIDYAMYNPVQGNGPSNIQSDINTKIQKWITDYMGDKEIGLDQFIFLYGPPGALQTGRINQEESGTICLSIGTSTSTGACTMHLVQNWDLENPEDISPGSITAESGKNSKEVVIYQDIYDPASKDTTKQELTRVKVAEGQNLFVLIKKGGYAAATPPPGGP